MTYPWQCRACLLEGVLNLLLIDAAIIHLLISCMCSTPDPWPALGEAPLRATIDGADRVTILPSQSRSFTCQVNASAVIRWTLNGHDLPNNVAVQDIGGYVSVLSLSSPNADNTGIYACLVHSQSGVFNARASIEVTFYGQSLKHSIDAVELFILFYLFI